MSHIIRPPNYEDEEPSGVIDTEDWIPEDESWSTGGDKEDWIPESEQVCNLDSPTAD